MRVLPPSPGTRLIPTSMTVAPGLIQSPRTISGRPMAATSTSARRQTEGRSLVREWVMVTVAFSAKRSCATGLPTMFERPATTASRPASVNGLGKNHTAHRGARHERRQPTGKAALIDQMETVDILRWIDCGNDLLCVDLFGEGQLDQNTTDFLVGIEPGNESEQLGFAGRCRELAIESMHS